MFIKETGALDNANCKLSSCPPLILQCEDQSRCQFLQGKCKFLGGAQWEISPKIMSLGKNKNNVNYHFFHPISQVRGYWIANL